MDLDEAIREGFGEEAEETPEQPPEQGASEPEQPEGTSRPRDEQGRFLSEAEIARQKYLERFGGDVDKALEAAVHADSMIGRQGQQMDDLNRQIQDLQQRIPSQPQQEQEFAITQDTVDWLDEQLLNNPGGAAEWALRNDRSGILYNRVMDAWYEMPGQARQAAAYERHKEYEALEARRHQEQAPLQAHQEQQQFMTVWGGLRQEIPDLDEFADKIYETAKGAPEIVESLKRGTPEAQAQVLRNLCKLAKFDSLQAPPEGAQALSQELSDQRQAFVASGSRVQEPETKSAGEKWAEDNLDPYLKPFYGSGWSVEP